MPEFLNLTAKFLGLEEHALKGIFLAWARVLPTLTLVPAFGLKALPAPTRVGLGVALAIAIAPALKPHYLADQALLRTWAVEFARGIPPALQAAALIWAALMAGSVIDALRGGQEQVNFPTFEEATSPFAVLLGLLTALVFLETGGAYRIAFRLATLEPQGSASISYQVTRQLVGSIEVALAVTAPIIAVAVIAEIGGAFIAKAATPSSVTQLLAPLRSILLLGVAALLLDRMAELLALIASQVP